ncbi:mitochondrial import protein Pam17-domain-containing protein [Schizothecium vesticola]|uniref:Presequence translocated-associated motor subunit PAM17 n=1 Tax=Schizothecium vesticola TaxID=314040 RepID=A0AA40F5W1_9PEZI|nr:mitochondrial import protein Pam17-domain-containing protein [Schizothecium vesticola]
MLRSSLARPAALLLRSAACPYATSSTVSPFSLAAPNKAPIRAFSRKSVASKPTTSALVFIPRRAASTTRAHTPDAELDARAASAAAAAQKAAHPETVALDWNTFFKLRKTRRRIQQVSSVVLGLTSGTGAGMMLSTGSADALVSKVPLDPFVTLGLMTFSSATLGWLVGPVLGSVIFNLFHRRFKTQMAVKESQLFARIKKNRVDPTTSSASNPVPDYYGEKISSVAGYREWLKDQRAFVRKQNQPFL